jgi:CheY-like chemotaxis protein
MKKILIVEDDQIVANIYRNKLSLEGFQVEVANTGAAGLEIAGAFRPDAVILDLMLPQMTGVEFMKKIRSMDGFDQLPVIVFSNTYLTNMVQEAWKAGATKCLSKANCTPKQVMEVLKTTLNITTTAIPGALVSKSASHARTGPAPTAARPVSGAPKTTTVSDDQFQAELVKTFEQNLSATLNGMRAQLQSILKAENESVRLKHVQELYRRIHAFVGNAAVAGLTTVAHVGDALEALLKELLDKPQSVNASVLRTVASTIDFIGLLFERGLGGREEVSGANILVVDDEAISRRAVSHSLEKARLKAQSVDSGAAALDLLGKTPFDLIFLDIDMPGMNGFELCAKLRTLSDHKKTPVVFVTTLNDFESRANSTMSGGNDFIAKPFLFMELAVKALVHLLRPRLAPAKRALAVA